MRKVIFSFLIFLGTIAGVSVVHGSAYETGDSLYQVRYDEATSTFFYQSRAPRATTGYRYRTDGFFIQGEQTSPTRPALGAPGWSSYNPNPARLYSEDKAGIMFIRNQGVDSICSDSGSAENPLDVITTCTIAEFGFTMAQLSPAEQNYIRANLVPPRMVDSWNTSIAGAVGSFANNNLLAGDQTFYASPIMIASPSTGQFPDNVPTNQMYYCYDTCNSISYKGATVGQGGILNALSSHGISWSPRSQEALKDYYDKPLNYSAGGVVLELHVDTTTNTIFASRDVMAPTGFVRSDLTPFTWRIRSPKQSYAYQVRSVINTPSLKYTLQGVRHDSLFFNNGDPVFTAGPSFPGNITSFNFTPNAGINVIFINYTSGPLDDPGDGGSSISISSACTAPVVAQTMSSSAAARNPMATGNILAAPKGSAIFDSQVRIPTGENLYTEVFAKQYLLDYTFQRVTGECRFDVPVQVAYNFSWTETVPTSFTPCVSRVSGGCEPGTGIWNYSPQTMYDRELVVRNYQVVRPYSYWRVTRMNVLKPSRTIVNNAALPNTAVTAEAVAENIPATIFTDVSEHVIVPRPAAVTLPDIPVTGTNSRPATPNTNFSSNAEAAIAQLQVRNDNLRFGTVDYMSSSVGIATTAVPTHLPDATNNGAENFYTPSSTIPHTVTNGSKSSSGSISYVQHYSLTTAADISAAVTGLQSVVVHTPTVNHSSLGTPDRNFDQSMTPSAPNRVILGRDITVNFSSTGQHTSSPGYGNQNYSRYNQMKRIWFPFEVIWRGTHYQGGNWIELTRTDDAFTFTVPEFVSEGTYNVVLQSWATNAPSINSTYCTNSTFNSAFTTYCSEQTFQVNVVGRMFDFRVYDIGDPRFETVFRTAAGSDSSTGFNYFSGINDRDGKEMTGRTPTVLLPVRPGSHPTEVATTPHNGYPFLFSFKTIGDYWNANNGMVIQPRFYFVSKDGGASQEVDLYYDTPQHKLVQVGGTLDRQIANFSIKLSDPFRNVSPQGLQNLGVFEWNNFLTAAQRNATTQQAYLKTVVDRSVQIREGYKSIHLNTRMRLLTGRMYPGAFADTWTQQRATQTWIGEYHLPIDPLILPAGTNLEELIRTKYKGKIDGRESEFLRGGYITVNFHIYGYKNGDSATPTIAYNASSNGNANMWSIEGQVRSSTSYLSKSYDYRFGDIIMFESDFSVKDSYGAGR